MKALRISIDCKATVNLGDFSRGAKCRGATANKSLDHDMDTKEKMIPFGILNRENNQLYIFYGTSYKASDFICDAIEAWWEDVKIDFPDVDEVVVFADNGSENNSHRTRFLSRMVDFGIKPDCRCIQFTILRTTANTIPSIILSLHWRNTGVKLF